MAESEQKGYKLYNPQNLEKLTPAQKYMKSMQKEALPEGWGKDFDANGDFDSWLNFCKEGCKLFDDKMQSSYQSPDAMFGENALYKKTVISPMEGKLSCKCTVFEPLQESESKQLMFIYVHGGGMCMHDGTGVLEWVPCTYGMQGHIGATVHFTNSVDECYPRGLNDVVSAIKYLSTTYKDKVKGICLHGESGGANLIVAAMLKMKQEEPEKDYVDCMYVECAYLFPIHAISEEIFATPEDIRGSVFEFAEEGPLTKFGRSMFKAYKGPEKDELEFLQDKFAWPYFATEEDFKNFPVTYVQSNECDQLKDIGLRLYRQLIGAGVEAFHSVEAGTFHAGEKFSMLYASMISKRRETLLTCLLDEKARKQQAEAAAAKEE